jgi:hypothetical protein
MVQKALECVPASWKAATYRSARKPLNKRESLKNKLRKSGVFLAAKKCPSTHHVSPQNDHNFTTIYHPKTHQIPQTPL